MRLQDAVSYFGSQNKLAAALGMSQGSMSSWDKDRIPLARALQVEKLTRGKIRVDMGKYMFKNRRSSEERRA
jgi:DNA-binding transcriptional regulator YdaS (Cro superfamily)